MLRPIQEVLALTMDSIKSIRENSNFCEVSVETTKDLVFEKKEHMRLAYLQEDWTQVIMLANDLLEMPVSTLDKEQAIWTKRKAGEHLHAKCYL